MRSKVHLNIITSLIQSASQPSLFSGSEFSRTKSDVIGRVDVES